MRKSSAWGQRFLILLLLICASIIWLEWIIFKPAVRLNNPSDKLPCVEEIKKVINNQDMEPIAKDFLQVMVEYGLTKQAQENYHSISFQKGWHFRDSNSLKKSINKASICNTENLPKVAMCSIVGEGINFVQEWMSHYILLGVDKFFIYTDQNSKQWEERLKPFIDLKLVKMIPWETRRESFGQIKAYDDCISVASHAGYEWGLFLDLDEYMTFNNEETCIPKFFQEFSANHQNPAVGGIALRFHNMKPYGGGVHDDTKTLYEQLPFLYETNEALKKLILYLPAAKHFDNAHVIHLKDGYSQYNTAGETEEGTKDVFNDRYSVADQKTLSLRHFWGFTLDYLLYEKVCGLGHERRKLSHLRAPMMMQFLSKTYPPVKLPPHPHQQRLHNFLFVDKRE